MANKAEDYINEKLGNDIDFKQQVFSECLVLKLLPLDALPKEALDYLELMMLKRKGEIQGIFIDYFNKNKESSQGFQKLEYKGNLDIAKYDGLSIVTNKAMLKISGKYIEGVSYK